MRLTRSNDEPQLLDDLERLARSYGPPDREPLPLASEQAAAVEPEAVAEEVGSSTAEASALDDPFVRRFVRVSVHVKRYAPFYAGAAVWAFAMLLIQPLGHGGDTPAGFATAAATTRTPARAVSAPAAAVTPEAVAAAPVFDDFGGSTLTAAATSTFDTTTTSSDDSSSSSFADHAASDAPATFDDGGIGSFGDAATTPEELMITASGYASATGGTPVEQDPGAGGLPVGALGGNENKRSYIRVTGDETTLRLQESPDNAVRPDAGGVKACLVGEAFTPARGQALSAAPAFDANNCSTGVRDATGLWTFDLSSFGPLADVPGFALTPAAGTASTFQVVFQPTPVPAAT